MLGVMGNSAIFAQQAGRGGRKIPEISFTSTSDDPFIQSLSCNGQIIIESIKDGAPVINKYYNLDKVMVEIEADSDTIVSIRGYVTELLFSVYNDDPDIDDWEGCFDIATINTSNNAILKKLSIALCESIEELDLAANTQLQTLYCNSCTGLTSISYPATNSNVSTSVANAITNASSSDGTVYTDSSGDYYNTIETAATAKGWTVEQIA